MRLGRGIGETGGWSRPATSQCLWPKYYRSALQDLGMGGEYFDIECCFPHPSFWEWMEENIHEEYP